MTNNKLDSSTIKLGNTKNYPAQTVKQFTLDIRNGLLPSKALKNFIKNNDGSRISTIAITDLLKRAYAGLAFNGGYAQILDDSGYPFEHPSGGPTDMTDKEFDLMVARISKLPPEPDTSDKPDLYLITAPLIESFPTQSVNQFATDIHAGLSPSKALNNFISNNACSTLDSSVIIDLLKQTYDGLEVMHFSGLLHDSGYPFGNPEDMDDDAFDKLISETYRHPPES